MVEQQSQSYIWILLLVECTVHFAQFLFWIFVNTMLRSFDLVLEIMVHCVTRRLFDKVGSSTPTNLGLPTWQGYQAISTVVVSCMKWTWISSIILLFHWGHEEPWCVALRAAIVWLENRNQRSTIALLFCSGFAWSLFYLFSCSTIRKWWKVGFLSVILAPD